MEYQRREIPVCEICQQPANQTCGGCKLVYYCSRAHQKLGWREGHKFKCRAFKVQFSDTLGRHMVASRDIKQGEMILKEKPAVSGPRISCVPHCLTCGLKLEPMQIGDKRDFYKCSSCNWPMCGLDCEKSEVHQPECKAMTKRKYRCDIRYERPDKSEAAYCVIAPMRVLLMKESNPLQYENIMSLQSHIEERMDTPLYTVLKVNLVTFIVQVLELPFDEETILKVASIYDTNSFDVRSPDGLKRVRAIYVTASMMNHSCRPNTRHIFLGDDHNLALIATVPIAKGELITATYTQSLWGTLDRRNHLLVNKCFGCECERCQDPTEFGTHLGNIYCSVCNGPFKDNGSEKGAILLSTYPLDESAVWKCERCEHYILGKQMIWGNKALKQELARLNKSNPADFERFIENYSQTLHPTNHLVVQAKLALMQIYGNIKGYMLADLPDNTLKRKMDICHDLLELADKLEPGWSKFRGTILMEMQSVMTLETKRDFESGKLTKEAAQSQLMEGLVLLQEAMNILKVEPHMQSTLESKLKELTNLLDATDTESNGVATTSQ